MTGLRAPVLAAALALALAPSGRAETDVPPFPRDGVAVAGVPDEMAAVRRFLAGFQSRVGAQYVVCVVAYTHASNQDGPDERSGVEYTDRVLRAWRASLDPAKEVLVVVSVKNRNVNLHTGADWAELGLELQAAVDVIQTSPFAARARAGDLPGAVQALIEHTDRELVRRRDARETAARTVAERAARQEREAADALARRELEARAAREADARAAVRAREELAAAITAARGRREQVRAALEASPTRAVAPRPEADAGALAPLTAAERARLEACMTRSAERLGAAEAALATSHDQARARLREAEAAIDEVAAGLEQARADRALARDVEAGLVLALAEQARLEERLKAFGAAPAAREALDAASRSLAQGRDPGLRAAADALQRARQQQASAARALDDAARLRAARVPVQARLDELKAWRGAPTSQDAPLLAQVDEGLSATAVALAHDDLVRADRTLDGLRAEIARVEERERDAAASARRLRVAGGTAGGLGGLGALAAFLLWRRRVRERAQALLAAWSPRVSRAAENVLTLKDQNPLVFAMERPAERFGGRTAQLFVEMAEQVDGLMVTYSAAFSRHEEARKGLEADGPLGVGGALRAIELLAEEEVELAPASVEDELLMPPGAVSRCRADELLGRVEAFHEGAVGRAAQVERGLLEASKGLERSRAALAACDEAASSFTARGLDPAGYQALHQALTSDQAALVALQVKDPVGALEGTPDLDRRVAALRERITLALAAKERMDGTERALVEQEQAVARLRRDERVALSEPRLDPEARAAAIRARHADARDAIARADEVRARVLAGEAAGATDELRRLVAATLAPRDATPARLAAQRATSKALRAHGEQRRGQLRALHDEAALQAPLADLDAAARRLDAVDERAAQVTAARERQHHLEAAALCDATDADTADVEGRHAAVETASRALDEARAAAEGSLAAALRDSRALDPIFRQGDGYQGSDVTLGAIQAVRARWSVEQQAQRAARPHWPDRRVASAALAADLSQVLAGTLAEHQGYVGALALLVAVTSRAASTSAGIEGTWGDLAGEHAGHVLEAADAHADEARRCLMQAQGLVLGAQQALTTRAYAQGVAAAVAAEQHVVRAAALAIELTKVQRELAATRDAARADLERARRDLEAYRGLCQPPADDRFASAPTADLAARVSQRVDLASREQKKPRPDWPAWRREGDALARDAAELLEAGHAEHAAWREVLALEGQVVARRAEVSRLLSGSTLDRREANELLAQADESLRGATKRVGRPAWGAVRDELVRADRLLKEARARAEADFSAARAAKDALAEGDAELRQGDRDHGDGERADLRAARGELDRARRLLEQQEYEQALRLARGARDQIEREVREARERVQRERAEERRKQDEARERKEKLEREQAGRRRDEEQRRREQDERARREKATGMKGATSKETTTGGSTW